MATTVVLFIAHDGISQPDIWSLWKKEYGDNVQFRVLAQTPHLIKMGNTFVQEHRLRQPDGNYYFMKQTKWASFSVVWETLCALWMIYLEYNGDFQRIFLISGTDIPIVSLTQWYHDNPSDTYNYVGNNNSDQVHSQWMSLTSTLVYQIIFDYLCFRNPNNRTSLERERETEYRYKIIKLFVDCNIACYTLRLQGFSVAPDETWLHWIDPTINKNIKENGAIVLPLFRSMRISPILWTTFDTPQPIGEGKAMTLQQYINCAQHQRSRIPSLLTVRKISKNAVLPVPIPFTTQKCRLIPSDSLQKQSQSQSQLQLSKKYQSQKQISVRIIEQLNKMSKLIEEDSSIIESIWNLMLKYNFIQQDVFLKQQQQARQRLKTNLDLSRGLLQFPSLNKKIFEIATKSSNYDDFIEQYCCKKSKCILGTGTCLNPKKISALKTYFQTRSKILI